MAQTVPRQAWTRDPQQMQDVMMRAIMPRVSRQPIALMRGLKAPDRREIRDEPARVFAKQRADLVAYSDALMNASPEDLADYAYGFALQQKELERRWRYAFPMPKEQVGDGLASTRMASDAELLGMATEVLGGGQKADSGQGDQG